MKSWWNLQPPGQAACINWHYLFFLPGYGAIMGKRLWKEQRFAWLMLLLLEQKFWRTSFFQVLWCFLLAIAYLMSNFSQAKSCCNLVELFDCWVKCQMYSRLPSSSIGPTIPMYITSVFQLSSSSKWYCNLQTCPWAFGSWFCFPTLLGKIFNSSLAWSKVHNGPRIWSAFLLVALSSFVCSE